MTTPAPPEPFKLWTDARGEQGFLHGTKAALAPGDLIEAAAPPTSATGSAPRSCT